MSVMIQIRNVPDDVHRVMKERAAKAGMSLSDYLLDEIGKIANRPTMEELVARVQARMAADLPISAADAVRAERDGR